jgi:hypothetical protein
MGLHLRFSLLLAALVAAYGQAPNAWLAKPGNLSRDEVSRSVREQRDAMWAGSIGIGKPLTQENAGARQARTDDYIVEERDFVRFRNEADFIATFTGSRCVMASSGDTIYTEITLRVSDVFFEDSHHGLKTGDDITTMEPGGTVKTDRGNISYLTQPIPYFWQPGKTYFLRMQYHSDGDWYSMEERWDVSDGVVRPDDPRQAGRAQRGYSTIVNLTRDQLVQAMRERLSVK